MGGNSSENWLAGRRVALAGRLYSMTPSEAAAVIEQRGGVLVTTPTEETAFVVVGGESVPLREDGRIPRKLRLAQDLQQQGAPLTILTEEEFCERLGLRSGGEQSLYTIGQLSRILEVPTRRIRTWMRHGLIEPVKTVHRLCYFDFRQVAGARSLVELVQSGVSLAEIRQSLKQLQSWKTDVEVPLAQLSILEENGQLRVRLASGQLVEASGQLQFDFLEQPPEAGSDEPEASPETASADPSPSPPPSPRASSPRFAPKSVSFKPTEITRTSDLEPAQDQHGEDEVKFQRTIPLPRAPRNGDDWFEVALDHEDCGDLDQAVRAYRQALLAGGPQPEFCFNLANVLYGLGKKDAAVERYHQALELDPNYVEAWNNLANVLTELGQWQEGLTAYRKALEIAPTYADAHYNLAETLDQIGRRREAERHYQAYLSLDPHSTWSEFVRRRLLEAEEGREAK